MLIYGVKKLLPGIRANGSSLKRKTGQQKHSESFPQQQISMSLFKALIMNVVVLLLIGIQAVEWLSE